MLTYCDNEPPPPRSIGQGVTDLLNERDHAIANGLLELFNDPDLGTKPLWYDPASR